MTDPFSAPLVITGMGFADHYLDRADAIRQDGDRLSALRALPSSRWLLLDDLKPVLSTADGVLDLLWQGPEAAREADDWVFLGLQGEVPHFAAVAASAVGKPIDARAAGQQLLDARGGVIAQARSLLAWHGRHKFCAVCGAPTDARKGGYARQCTNTACKAEHFPRTDPVVIMLALDGDQCLLGRQPGFPAGFYSALAGFVEPGETLEAAVAREIMEEAGVRIGRVRYVASQPWPFPSSMMIGCFAEAASTDIHFDTTELEDARWFTRDDCAAALNWKGSFLAPPSVAIAHHLLKAWVEIGD
jgi:NAD+ diphosphatase